MKGKLVAVLWKGEQARVAFYLSNSEERGSPPTHFYSFNPEIRSRYKVSTEYGTRHTEARLHESRHFLTSTRRSRYLWLQVSMASTTAHSTVCVSLLQSLKITSFLDFQTCQRIIGRTLIHTPRGRPAGHGAVQGDWVSTELTSTPILHQTAAAAGHGKR